MLENEGSGISKVHGMAPAEWQLWWKMSCRINVLDSGDLYYVLETSWYYESMFDAANVCTLPAYVMLTH